MPTYDYRDYSTPQPTVHYCRRTDEVDEHVAKLKGATIGLDLEWKVLLRRTMIHGRVAVVQVADAERIIIAHVHHMDRFPIRLRELIESKSTAKVGANILNDGKKLFADWGIIPNALVELGSVAQTVDPKSANASFGKRKVVSLSRLTAKYCNKHLDKGSDRTSNWEVERLSTSQLHYAANDVHASVQIFQAITNDLSSETLPLTLANLSIRAGDDLNDLPLDDTVPISPPPVFGSRMFAGEVLTPVMEDAGMRSQFLRAYREWHWKHCDVWDMATRLSLKGTGEPLKVSTVISYIVQALTIDKKLPFDMGRLRLLLLCDEGSWVRHKNWVIQAWQEGRGRRKTRPAGSKLNKVPE
ncbi:ribonuclease H-like domain-containing protein [Flagelloscypha sp. PMI_526]|nr:ribonuclease H-like domain-containing protein [Flagelloscypha sp. PMI_526]